MKVALVVPGGVDRSGTYRVVPFLLWLIERIAREHEVHVFALRQVERTCRYHLHGATVHAVGPRPRRLRAATAIWREHRRGPFDVLHALWATPQGVLAGLMGNLLRCPVVLHLVGGDLRAIPDIGYGLLLSFRGRWWLRAAVSRADRVLVSSREMIRFAASLDIEVEAVPFGVDQKRWPGKEPEVRRQEDVARLLHVASLNPVKDQTTLLEAFARILDSGIDGLLDIVGEDTLNGRIQTLAAELGIEQRVCFHGFLPHHELRPIVEAAHLLILSSRHESGPLVLQEAALVGVPTVGTAVGHLVEWAPEAAVAVPVADPRALAEAVVEVLTDEERRLRLARNAQRRAVEKDADWTANQVIRIYEEVTADSDRPLPRT